MTTSESTSASPIVEGNGSANPGSNESPIVIENELAPAAEENGEEGSSNPPEPTAQPKMPEWFQKRFDELTAKRYQAERERDSERDKAKAIEGRNAALLEQIAKTSGTPAPTPAPTQAPQMSEEEIDKRANERAKAISQANEFNKACNTIVDVGKKEYKDWDDAIKNLNMVGAIGPADRVSPEFLETVVELKNPHQVLHYLGTNPEEASKIANMSPKKMALELARVESTLASKASEKPPVSNAPAPVIPITGKGTAPIGTLDDPNLPADSWFELRAKQIEERKNRYRRN